MSSLPKKRKQEANNKGKDNNTNPRLLSCQRCRTRKIKCNVEYPCSNCTKAGADCIKTVNDMRKKRPPANYVSNLEKQIENLTDFFEKFKNLDSIEAKQKLMDSTDLNVFINKDYQEYNSALSEMENYAFHSPKHDIKNSSMSVYGPTSVYDNDLITGKSKSPSKREEVSINNFNKDPNILHCLKLFFTWQYPDHNMFIFREAFLIDFFDPKPNSLYCSRNLVLSICALGSRMSDDDKIYSRSIEFYNEARVSLLSQLDHPSITSLQSFLLLAFYDICDGSNSSGWMLSGNAMRMGFDLGFQLNPEVWFLKSHDDLSPLDVAIRSRIYWGSYMADHFISLLLGRPSLLKISDATIPETDDLPDLEWIDDYRYLDPKSEAKKDTQISNPLKNVIKLINISDSMLNDIFTRSEDDHDKNNDDINLLSRMEKLSEYNSHIMKWKESLPEDLAWDKSFLQETADNPTLLCIRYYYYILILCLNRPFVGISKSAEEEHHLSPAIICTNAIEDLYVAIRRFKETHGLRRASIFMVYCSILSISVILLTNKSKQLVNKKQERLQFFMNVLHDCSRTWKLAEKSYKLIKIKLQHSHSNEIESKREENTSPNTNNLSTENLFNSKPSNFSNNLQQDNGRDHFQLPWPFESNSQIRSTTRFQKVPFLPRPRKEYTEHPGFSPNEHTSSLVIPRASITEISSSSDKHDREYNKSIADANTELLFDENLEFFGGPPVLMTSDLFNEDWESLFPDYIFNPKN
mmetsp:Transcript_5382/g.6241  ORF Transcript_5382/g.6241 Transcript_5382/m.6241 type:complete len:749 (+) Transcript_5382:2399-4645(+)